MKIQLAIQGGGAKLTTLLAAASALQTPELRDRVHFSRIVGTSAGAIVGALLATGVDIEGFKQQLLAGIGRRISGSLPKPTRSGWVRTALTGKPLWQDDVLKSILQDVLSAQGQLLGKPLTTLSEIKAATGIELRIVAADLRSPRPIVYKPDGNDKDVVTALMDSAGIPVYFRTWRHGSIVDGGLVQNFPWDELLETQMKKSDPIVDISFASATRDLADNRSEYASALLNTALDSATERSRQRIGPDRILTLPSEFDTFDFESALAPSALNSHFSLVKLQTVKWFETRLQHAGILILDDPWVSTSLSVMEKLGRMYESQHEGTLLKYQSFRIEIAAYTLEGRDQPDVVSYSFSFFALDKDVYCHSIALSQGPKDSGFFKQSTISLVGPDGKLIPTDYLPMVDPLTPENREIVLFFDRVLPAGSGPYTLTIQDTVRGLMIDLLNDRRDVLFVRAQRTAKPVGVCRAILHVPGSYQNARMSPAKDLDGQVEGRAMTPMELNDFQPPAPGWITMGWTGDEVHPQKGFGPSITI